MIITIHSGDKGTTVEASIVTPAGVAIDVSAAASALFRFEKPGSPTVTVDKVATTPGANLVRFVDDGTLFDTAGTWRVQGFVVISAGTDEFWTSKLSFEVAIPLAVP